MATIPFNNQFYIGTGVDSLSQKTYGVALDFDPPQAQSPGQTATFSLESITSSRELVQSLNISASASLDLGIFSASAEFDLARSQEINTFYTYALVRISVANPPVVIRNPRLKVAARNLLEQQGWDAFAGAYGWEYVSGIVTGGTFYGMIEIQTTDITEQQKVKVALSVGYGPFSGSGELTAAFTDISTRFAMNARVFRAGGGAPISTTWDEMLNEARNFPATAQANPVSIQALTNDYRSSVPLPSLSPPDSLPVLQQKVTLEDLGREYLRLRDYKTNIEFILNRNLTEFDEFRDLDTAGLLQKKAEFEESLNATVSELDTITQRARACYNDISQCSTFVPSIRPLQLPHIGGDMLTLRQLEDKLSSIEANLVPVGTIVPFYGSLDQANALSQHGWWVCDGRVITDPTSPRTGQPTPNLHDRFLLGSMNQVGNVGGSVTTHVPGQEITSFTTGEWNSGITMHKTPQTVVFAAPWRDGSPIESKGMYHGADVSTMPPYFSVIYIIKAR